MSNFTKCSQPLPNSSFELSSASEQMTNRYVAEHLNIGGAPINIFKLLGIHDRGRLIDLTGNGVAISSGEFPEFPALNAFQEDKPEWRSTQRGQMVTNAFLGYDFGPIRLDNGRLRYGVETGVRQQITTIIIKQGCEERNRVSKVRVERSDDGVKWYGVDIVTLPNTPNNEQIAIKQSAPSRYWRLRPIEFYGNTDDSWVVFTLQLIDFTATSLGNVQDEFGFLENRDRRYATESIRVKGFYDLQEIQTELTRFSFGASISSQFVFRLSFSAVVEAIGRPIVIGDILEIPSEAQYTTDLTYVKKYLEVTDVGWGSEGFTPGWKPTIQRVIAEPMTASQETADIVGDLGRPSNINNFFGLDTGSGFSIEAFISDAQASSAAKKDVPERGADTANVRNFSEEEITNAGDAGIVLEKLNINNRALYVEDGLPPNGESYTEGDVWPENPSNGDYHRLTFVKSDSGIPPCLYRYSSVKRKWIFVEEDKRFKNNQAKPTLQRFLTDPSRVPNDQIEK